MKVPTLVLNALTIALGIGLAQGAAAAYMTPPLPGPTAISPAPLAETLIVFGKDRYPAMPSDGTGATIVSAASLTGDAIGALAAAPSGRVLASLSSADLPLSGGDTLSLGRLYEKGIPVLLHMDDDRDEDMARVARLFGIAPRAIGDVIVVQGAGGIPQIYAAEGETTSLASVLAAAARAPALAATARGRIAAAAVSNAKPLAPTQSYNVNFVDEMGEVSGANIIEVVRSRTNGSDEKFVNIASRVTVRTSDNGVVDGERTGNNLWGTYLPTEYRVSQKLTADGVEPQYLSHFPETDERTDHTRSETKTRGFSIGGSTGTELSASGNPDEVLAAKLPFNISLGYEYSRESSVSSTFKDYSILAVPEAQDSVEWRALLNDSLKDVLVKRTTGTMPELSEARMSPTMRAITFNTLSEWVLPGDYEGLATVTLSAGYELQRTEWWWHRADVKSARTTTTRDVPLSFVVDMSDPHLTSEITVLIRSAVGAGECLRDDGDVVLAACNVMDRKQMWGLDASNRYVNRGTGHCLTADTATQGVVTRPCGITFEQQWEWRADRLHSFIDHAKYRLYVEGGQVHYHAAEGRFQDYPVNPYGTPLAPWTNTRTRRAPASISSPRRQGASPSPSPMPGQRSSDRWTPSSAGIWRSSGKGCRR